jgi:hypothetical protein
MFVEINVINERANAAIERERVENFGVFTSFILRTLGDISIAIVQIPSRSKSTTGGLL